MQTADCYHALRQLLEIDRDLGVQFVSRRPPTPAGQPDVAAPEAPTPAPIPTVTGVDKPAVLRGIAELIGNCQRCPLARSRTHTVPGEGDPEAEILFIGEAPGRDEDLQGRPFVGAAGQLLDKMIAAMGLSRKTVFIANILKCRPPGNRRPEEHEMAACLGYITQQARCLAPRVICTLGNTPLKALKPEADGITRERGRPFQWLGIPVIPTFHPSYLLRNPSAKKPCWEDLQAVLKVIGREPPARR